MSSSSSTASLEELAREIENDDDAVIPVETAAGILAARYGLKGDLVSLPGERDRNFLLSLDNGQRFIFKIAGPAEPKEVTDLQLEAIRWLARSATDLSLPRLQPARSGKDAISFADVAGRVRICRLLSYVPGTPLRAGSYDRQQRIAAGEACGKLATALQGFQHPAAKRDLVWDVMRAHRLAPLIEYLPENSQHVARRLISQFREEVDAHAAHLPQQLIHNDLNTGNLMTNDDRTAVTGIIDFGDVLWTATIVDAAIGAASVLDPQAGLEEALTDYMSGYARHRKPDAAERALFPKLVAMRLLMLMIIPAWHRQLNPNNAHYAGFDPRIELNTARIIQLLDV